ncbi:topoisomerase DNA-binding C4 zinc finger domain-containing protein [Ethanoligenens sp.]|uniref:topoisomerase DNA-binding C4 zinc finger domain-containing protein n=1 Tax=Ethanoligenens sp. TaxID=2099655 RepID=UPI0039EC049D
MLKPTIKGWFEFEKATVGNKFLRCEGTLIERYGKYGSFLGYSNFPKCKFSKQI